MSTTFKKDSHTAWHERILKELKGRPFEDLVSRTSDGIEIQPYYTSSQKAGVISSGLSSPWRIRQEFMSDEESNNTLIHEALMSGIDSISVNAAHLEKDLDKVNIDMIEVEVAGDDFHPSWMEEVLKRNLSGSQVQGGYAWDPLGGILISGNFDGFDMMPTVLKMMCQQVEKLPDWYVLNVCGDNYHNAGASPVQELAFCLAQVNLYLKQETAMAPRMALTLAAGTDYFETVSKFRAMRILWANLMKAQGQKAELKLFARSSTKDLSPVDQHSNLLRATTQAMAAIAGGAERIVLHPFDGEGDAFSYRMARNIQHLLIHESYMDKTANPVDGAYLFEELTTEMASKSWEYFKTIEAQGGWDTYALNGKIQNEVKNSAERWAADINSGDRTWLGVNRYPSATQPEWKGIEVEQEGLALPSFKNNLI